jgi:hypothetical protein
VFVDADGNIAQSSDNAVGWKMTYFLTHPDYVLYVGKVGDNTSQKSDENVGGQKFLVAADEWAL